MEITEIELHEASLLLESVEPHMLRVFESIGVVDEAQRAGELEKFVAAHGWLTADDLWRFVRNIMTQKDFEETLKSAVRAGSLKVEMRNSLRGVRLPKPGGL